MYPINETVFVKAAAKNGIEIEFASILVKLLNEAYQEGYQKAKTEMKKGL